MKAGSVGLQIKLFGQPQIIVGDGSPLLFTRRKTAALLYYLAVNQRVHERIALTSFLWPTVPRANAFNSLRTALAALRAKLGVHLHVTQRTMGLVIDPSCWVDVAQFREALEGKWSDIPQERLETAVNLYAGSFLDGFRLRNCESFETWMLGERAVLRQLAIDALFELSQRAQAQADDAAALQWTQRLLELEPLYETAVRQQIVLLSRLGKTTAARTYYERFVARLWNEIEVEPEPKTAVLYEQLIQTPVVIPCTAPVESASLIGRQAELAYLRQRLNDPACRLLNIVGIGGCGKSRLAQTIAHQIAVPAAGDTIFTDGIYWLPLAGIDARNAAEGTLSPLVLTIADAMNFTFAGQQPLRPQLMAFLHGQTALLILDNFEHLLTEAGFIREIVKTCPNIKLLVTSRIPLNIRAEQQLMLTGLPVPTSPEKVSDGDAVTLFYQRARHAL